MDGRNIKGVQVGMYDIDNHTEEYQPFSSTFIVAISPPAITNSPKNEKFRLQLSKIRPHYEDGSYYYFQLFVLMSHLLFILVFSNVDRKFPYLFQKKDFL